jgi:Domain of unknown function (DUF4296)
MRIVLFLFLTFSLLCCANNGTPADIISREKMETILWQLMQSDEFVSTTVMKDSTKNINTERIKIYQQVFDLNKTSKAAFKKSYQYYLGHPDIAKLMFDSIAARAGRQREDAYRLKTKAVK